MSVSSLRPSRPKWFPKQVPRSPKIPRPSAEDALTIGFVVALRAIVAERYLGRGGESHGQPLADPGGDRVRVACALPGCPSRGRDDSPDRANDRPAPIASTMSGRSFERPRRRGSATKAQDARDSVTPGATGPSSERHRRGALRRCGFADDNRGRVVGQDGLILTTNADGGRATKQTGIERDLRGGQTVPSARLSVQHRSPSTPKNALGGTAIDSIFPVSQTLRRWRALRRSRKAATEGGSARVGRASPRRRPDPLRRQVRRRRRTGWIVGEFGKILRTPGRRRDLARAGPSRSSGHRVLRSPRPADAVRARCW